MKSKQQQQKLKERNKQRGGGREKKSWKIEFQLNYVDFKRCELYSRGAKRARPSVR